jgi:hypothetical protein
LCPSRRTGFGPSLLLPRHVLHLGQQRWPIDVEDKDKKDILPNFSLLTSEK